MDDKDAKILNHPGFLAFRAKRGKTEDTQAADKAKDQQELADDKQTGDGK